MGIYPLGDRVWIERPLLCAWFVGAFGNALEVTGGWVEKRRSQANESEEFLRFGPAFGALHAASSQARSFAFGEVLRIGAGVETRGFGVAGDEKLVSDLIWRRVFPCSRTVRNCGGFDIADRRESRKVWTDGLLGLERGWLVRWVGVAG